MRSNSPLSRLQDVADAAALAGAWELGLAIDDSAAIARAEDFVKGQVSEWAEATTIVSDITVEETRAQRIIKVKLNGHRPSFFGSMLPPGGWRFNAEAGATTVGMVPLCVLVSGSAGSKVLNLQNNARLSAPACLVHSNRDIAVEGGSISASMTQAVTSASGMINPAPGTGAAAIDDPFSQMVLDPPANCSGGKVNKKAAIIRLPAGVHCGGLKISGTQQLILEPGEHWFKSGPLELSGEATLSGTDVVLFFDKASKFVFQDQSVVTLEGRRTGAYAGMVMAATRDDKEDFLITSDNVENLLGVIYVPNAVFIVKGSQDVARDSAWTVIVAKSLQLTGSPSLIINANYTGSAVPVPQGVGPRAGGSTLVN